MSDRVTVPLSVYEWFEVCFDDDGNPTQVVRSQIEWLPGERFRMTASLRQAIDRARKIREGKVPLR